MNFSTGLYLFHFSNENLQGKGTFVQSLNLNPAGAIASDTFTAAVRVHSCRPTRCYATTVYLYQKHTGGVTYEATGGKPPPPY